MKGLLSKLEYLVIAIFAFIFLIWAASKCTAQKEQLQEQAAAESSEDSLAQGDKKTKVDTVKATPAEEGEKQPAAAKAPATQQPAPASSPAVSGPRLYVTIDRLKLRKSPGLKGEMLGELRLFEEVYYMDEVTDSTYEISLGKEIANEPYVKIKTSRGTVGWVYGAGVHYAKKKRTGVLE
jgi:hypothetical protein